MDNLRKNHKEFIRNKKLILKLRQRCRSKKHVFTEEASKIALTADKEERIQSIDLIETHA